jgi:hypothetical protein
VGEYTKKFHKYGAFQSEEKDNYAIGIANVNA